jgi:hypothetical protein
MKLSLSLSLSLSHLGVVFLVMASLAELAHICKWVWLLINKLSPCGGHDED